METLNLQTSYSLSCYYAMSCCEDKPTTDDRSTTTPVNATYISITKSGHVRKLLRFCRSSSNNQRDNFEPASWNFVGQGCSSWQQRRNYSDLVDQFAILHTFWKIIIIKSQLRIKNYSLWWARREFPSLERVWIVGASVTSSSFGQQTICTPSLLVLHTTNGLSNSLMSIRACLQWNTLEHFPGTPME